MRSDFALVMFKSQLVVSVERVSGTRRAGQGAAGCSRERRSKGAGVFKSLQGWKKVDPSCNCSFLGQPLTTWTGVCPWVVFHSQGRIWTLLCMRKEYRTARGLVLQLVISAACCKNDRLWTDQPYFKGKTTALLKARIKISLTQVWYLPICRQSHLIIALQKSKSSAFFFLAHSAF